MCSVRPPRSVWASIPLHIILVIHLSAQDPARSAIDSNASVRPERDVLLTADVSTPAGAAIRNDAGPAWTVTTFERRNLSRHPSRSLEGLMSLLPGFSRVVSPTSERLSSGTSQALHLRGSREGEIEYRFGGLPATDRWSNMSGVPFLPEMLEAVDVHNGAYGAALGMMGGGLVDMKLREGGDALSFDAMFLTDDFARPGEQFLNTSSYGWTSAVVTVESPLPFESSAFIAAEVSRKANFQPMYLEPINITLVPDYYNSNYYPPPPAPFVIGRNHVPSQSSERSVVQWNLVSKALGPSIAFLGSVSSGRTRQVSWPSAVTDIYRQARIPWTEENSTFAALKADHEVTSSLSVSASVSYRSWRQFTTDPALGEQWRLYADSAANADAGYPGFTARYTPPRRYAGVVSFWFSHANEPSRTYQRQASDAWTASLRGRTKLSDHWMAEVSGEAEWWTFRKFQVGNVYGISSLDWNRDGVIDQTFASEDEERVSMNGAYILSNFGYDFRGRETDDGIDAPRRPSLASLSLQSTWTEGPLSLNAGVRAQWISMDMPYLPPQRNPATGGMDWRNLDDVWDYSLQTFRPNVLHSTEAESYLLPRLSLRYEGATGSFFAAYGAYVETQPHEQIQLDVARLGDLLEPWWGSPYNLGGSVIPFMVKASRTQQMEAGFTQRVIGNLTARAAVYYKTLSRQVQMGTLPSSSPDVYPPVAFVNSGESSSAGLELGLHAEPLPGCDLDVSYARSRAEGQTSYPRSNRMYYTDEALYTRNPPAVKARPLSYEREHRIIGSVGFIAPAESPLTGLHVRLIGTTESGTAYTLVEPIRNMGGASVWNVGVRSLMDVRTSVPIEYPNESRTPWVSTVDLSVSYEMKVWDATIEIFALIKNLLDTKNVINVYPTTGSAVDDSWLRSPYSPYYTTNFPQYEEFYRYLNLRNRWAYMNITGADIYGAPRQIQVGARVGI